MSSVNGAVPITVLQKSAAPPSAPRAPRANQPRQKLILRRLPPGMTKAELDHVLAPDWAVGGGKVEWMIFKKGKISKDLAKPSVPARAYFQITSPDNVAAFGDFVKQATFHDAAKTFQDSVLVGPPALEFAPYHRIPGGRRRNDARQGLIDQDQEFKDFLEALTNPVTKPAAPEAGTETKEEKVKTTPLIEALREKKANKDKPQGKGKHGRAESKEDAAEKGDKKILGKSSRENAQPAGDKGKRLSKAERAAKDAVKVLNKEASNAKETAASSSSDKAAPTPTPERKRGNVSIAKSMLQRDLGIGPAPTRGRRGTKREVASAAEPATKPDEAAAGKQKAKETSTTPHAPAEKTNKSPTSPKKENPRPTRAERRAFKAQQAEKATTKPAPEGPKSPTGKGPATPAPTILKKPQNTPAGGQKEPPKGPSAARNAPAGPSAPPTKNLNPPPAAGPASSQPVASSTPGKQAFLKHANPSQGITEPLIEEALKVFGAIEKVEIDKRKGFAYVDFVDAEGLQKAIAASPVKVAQGAVQVLERKEKVARRNPHVLPHGPPHGPPTGPARGRGGFGGRGRGRGGGRGGASNVASEGAPATTATPTPAPAVADSAT